MANYSHLHEVKLFRQSYYNQSQHLYPADFAEYYRRIPVYLPDGTKIFFGIRDYISSLSEGRSNQATALRRKIRDTWGADLHPSLQTWLSSKRLAACFSGHGLPEEISMLASYAAYCGYKSAGELPNWLPSVFGLDCNGFVNAYFTALTTFKKALYYIPSYTQHAGFALEENEISFDSVICFARRKVKKIKIDEDGDGDIDRIDTIVTKDWQVRPNPGNQAHVMVIDDWTAKWDTVKVTQMSATYKLDTHLYDIVDPPAIKKKRRAVFRIRRKDTNKTIDVMISKRMPEWLGKDGAEES